MSRKFVVWAAFIAALAIVLSGCSSSKGSTGSGDLNRELRIGLTNGPTNLDPARDKAGLSNVMRSLTNTALFHLNADYSVTPELVSDYGYVGEGNTVFEMTVKPNIKFTDGEPLNAAAVKTWLEYFQAQPGPFASALRTSSIDVEGDYKVRLHLAVPNPIVPLLLTQFENIGAVSSPKAVANPELMATGTYGVGPYQVDPAQSVAGDHYTLVPSQYTDQSEVHFKKVSVRVIPNANSMLQAYQAGQLDFGTIDPTVADKAKAAGFDVLHWTSGTVVVTLLDRDGTLVQPLSNVKVRQALNYAVDRKAITSAMVGKYGTPSSQLKTDHTDQSKNDYYPYDPGKAKQLLSEAGYPDGFTISVVDGGNTSSLSDPTMQLVANYWEKIGVKTQVTQAQTNFTAQALSKTFAAAEWTPGIAPTWNMYSLLYGQNASINPFMVKNQQLDDLFQTAITQPKDQADKTWTEFDTAVTESALNVPVYEYHTPWAISPKLTGAQTGSWVIFAADLKWKS